MNLPLKPVHCLDSQRVNISSAYQISDSYRFHALPPFQEPPMTNFRRPVTWKISASPGFWALLAPSSGSDAPRKQQCRWPGNARNNLGAQADRQAIYPFGNTIIHQTEKSDQFGILGFPSMGPMVPQARWMFYFMENQMKMDDLRVPLF